MTAPRTLPPARRDRRREAGYNLVILMIAVTVMSIMVAAAIPLWRTAIRRDKEEELIFRGLQYAEGMRTFQRRYGRLPVRLEELVETKPRCMRKLWADPITGKRDWVAIRVIAPGAFDPNAPPGGGKPGADVDGRPDPGDQARDDGETGQPQAPPGSGGFGGTPDGGAGLGPIRGVRSRSREAAIKTFLNQSRYDQWQFTVEILAGGAPGIAIGGVNVANPVSASMRWIGRPFRPGLNPGMGGGMQPGGGGFGVPGEQPIKPPSPPAPRP